MSTWGTTTPSQTVGRIEQVLANPHGAIWLPIGATIDWAGVTAATADATLVDSTPMYAGEKVILRGTLMTRTGGTAEVQTVTKGGSPTGGTFDLTLSKQGAYGTETETDTFDYDVTAAAMQTVLQAFYGAGKATVAYASNVWTITFSSTLGNVTVITGDATNMTGGTPTLVVATSTGGVQGGLWLPYVSGTLVNGSVGILNTTVKEANVQHGLNGHADGLLTGLLIGGTVWAERVNFTTSSVGVGVVATAANIVTMLAALPQVNFVYGDR